MLLSGIASLTTIIFYKYLGDSYLLTHFPHASLRIVYGALSGVLAAIAVASRINFTPTLANNLPTLAGLEMAGLGITLGIGCIGGAGSAIIILFVEGPSQS
jgi:hypothetical protein